MRVVFIIFGIIALLAFTGGSLLLSVRNGKEAKEMEKVEALGALGDMASQLADVPSKGSWQTAQIFSYIALLAGLFGIVGLFLKGKIGMIAAGVVALIALLLWILQPGYDAGAYGGANPKTIAMILMIIGLVGAGCIYGVQNANKKAASA